MNDNDGPPRRFVRIPNPGEFRGQGDWINVPPGDTEANAYFEYCRDTGYLPVYEGTGNPPQEGQEKP